MYHGYASHARICIRINGDYPMPNATVRANARILPNAHLRPEAALEQVLLAERAQLTAGRLTRKRRVALACCDRLLFKLALFAELEVVR
jgi:hypothetical protein